jgi:hypothetical protein
MTARPPDILFNTYPVLTAPASGEITSVYQPPTVVAKNFVLFVTYFRGFHPLSQPYSSFKNHSSSLPFNALSFGTTLTLF